LRERLKAARRNKGGARKTKRKQSKGKRKTRKN
jgi:hypothetical protein